MTEYKLNLRQFVTEFLPSFLRGNGIIEFLCCLSAPLKNLHLKFNEFQDQTTSALSYNAQLPHLQRLLNDKYDDDLRGIKVKDNTRNEVVIVYPTDKFLEFQVAVVEPVICSSFTYVSGGFIVEIPFRLSSKIDNIKAFVNSYKLCGVYYTTRITGLRPVLPIN